MRWVLESDPSIRWQVARDIIGAPADEVARERACVAREGGRVSCWLCRGAMAEAVGLVASKRGADCRWRLDTRYLGLMPVQLGDGEGLPSRWNTLRALRVLHWYSE